jgi:tudor domain-containing protein 1/4/6/7
MFLNFPDNLVFKIILKVVYGVLLHIFSTNKRDLFVCHVEDFLIFCSVFYFSVMDSIYDHYSTLDDTTGCLVSPDIGQPCVAVFEDDGSWYRASVQDMSLSDLNVKFVDYGNAQKVKPFKVKQIEPRFMKLPKLAMECTVDYQRSEWTNEETEKFKAVIGEDKQTAEILKEKDGKYLVKIFQGSECVSDSMLIKPGNF